MPNGSVVRQFDTGVQGTGNGQLRYPSNVAVDKDGNVYIDDGNFRVQKFSPTGTYLRSFGVAGVRGTDNQHLTGVTGLAFDSHGLLYIADSGYDATYGRIQVFKTDGTFVRSITRAGVAYVGGLAIDPNDHLYVEDPEAKTLLEFNPNGTFVRTRLTTDRPDLGGLTRFAFGPDGTFFIRHFVNNVDTRDKVVQYSPSWEKVCEFDVTTEPGAPENQYLIAYGIAVSRDSTLYIADAGMIYQTPIFGPPTSTPNPRIVKYVVEMQAGGRTAGRNRQVKRSHKLHRKSRRRQHSN